MTSCGGVEPGAPALFGPITVVCQRLVNEALGDFGAAAGFLLLDRDGNREMRNAVEEIDGAIERIDNPPGFVGIAGSLATFLEINRYSPHNGTQPKFLVDMLPEVHGSSSDAMLRRLLSRKGVSEQEREAMLAAVEERGSAYLPQVNTFYIRDFQMMHAAEDAARFLHQACQGLPRRVDGTNQGERVERLRSTDHFYARVIEHAVAFFGSRVLHPSRTAPGVENSQPLSRAACDKAAQEAARGDAEKFESTAQAWGYRCGSLLYDAYLASDVNQSSVRRLLLAHLDEPGVARKICAAVIAKLRCISRLTD